MSERDNPLKQRVSQIIRKITMAEDEYVLDQRFIRWGKVERDLWDIINDASQPVNAADRELKCNCDGFYQLLGVHRPGCLGNE